MYSSRNDRRTLNSVHVRGKISNTLCRERGMMPACSPKPIAPSIVCVLPVPVCPYANTVQLKPCKTWPMMGMMDSSNTSFCVEY